MSLQLTSYPINTLANHTLASFFGTLCDAPIALQITTKHLNLQAASAIVSPSLIELVLFADASIEQLLDIIEQAALSTVIFTQVVHRNAQTSYRFQVQCTNLHMAKQAVAQYSLANNIEAALLENAPQLAKPGLLVMDMDSTTIGIECIDEIAKLAGVGEAVAAVTERAMLGELDFAQSLHQRVATLANADVSILDSVLKNMPLMSGLTALLHVLKQHQWRIAIASGGFTYFAEHLQQSLALDKVLANQLAIHKGKLTGKVLGEVIDAQAKADFVPLLAKLYQIDGTQTVAMGDGANDLLMMATAHLGVAFHAKPIVLQQANTSINHQGLDILLHWLR